MTNNQTDMHVVAALTDGYAHEDPSTLCVIGVYSDKELAEHVKNVYGYGGRVFSASLNNPSQGVLQFAKHINVDLKTTIDKSVIGDEVYVVGHVWDTDIVIDGIYTDKSIAKKIGLYVGMQCIVKTVKVDDIPQGLVKAAEHIQRPFVKKLKFNQQ